MNVKSYVAGYLSYCQYRKELDVKTIKAYRIDLRQFFDFVSCDDPKKPEIEQYLMELHQKYKQKTVKRKIASVKAFYAYLEAEDIIPDTPFRKIKVKFKETKILPRIIPRTEIERLLNCMYSYQTRNAKGTYILRDLAIMELLFASGARVSEISNLKDDCVDLASGTLRIMGKGGKERYIPIASASTLDLLRKYHAKYCTSIENSGYFFINHAGRRYTEQSIRLMIKKYSKMAGIKTNITPHMFRHSFATYLIEEGVDISCVQQILGHSSIKTTQIYVHIAARKQAEILKEYHPRMRMKISVAA